MGIELLNHADSFRRQVALGIGTERKSELGQFMTPATVARFMASLFPESREQKCMLLDAGAGAGALSSAFLNRWEARDGLQFGETEVIAYEVDKSLRGRLESILRSYAERLPVHHKIFADDFILAGALQTAGSRRFTHAIMNPPYRKINSDSEHRLTLRQAGIETVNLYSAFVALTLALMKQGGQVVAIIPRSFCNGPYYRPFRQFLLRHAALHQIHLFGSRSKAFKDDDVLQENVIIRLERGGQQGKVRISTSSDDGFADLVLHEHPFERIVFPEDAEQFIHIPTSLADNLIEQLSGVRFSLSEIGVGVSTGPVVDFRLQKHIEQTAKAGTVPLLYPGHFVGSSTRWPKEGMKRGNAIRLNGETKKWLYPNGFYAVARRFSAKEERRRIVASVVRPDAFPNAPMLGFENHLNVFHEERQGLPEDLANGLAAFLNTTAIDEHFRRFNGHTQVNATDLRSIKYPSRATLIAFGKWARGKKAATQAMLDNQLKKLAE